MERCDLDAVPLLTMVTSAALLLKKQESFFRALCVALRSGLLASESSALDDAPPTVTDRRRFVAGRWLSRAIFGSFWMVQVEMFTPTWYMTVANMKPVGLVHL